MPPKHLIADEFGTHIGKHSQRLRLTRSKTHEKLGDYPLLHLEAVLILSQGVSISADAINACSERGIPVFFIAGTGRVYALVYSAALV
ncbi:MAG: CRISPR-associated endonuclease Cas1, partial [Ardenticatenia bacterium]